MKDESLMEKPSGTLFLKENKDIAEKIEKEIRKELGLIKEAKTEKKEK